MRYSIGFRSPSARPPLPSRYWFITAAIPAQIGADWEVPPPTTSCWFEHDPHTGERVGDRGDIGGQPSARILVGRDAPLPVGTVEQRGHAAAGALRQRNVEPRLLGQPHSVRIGGQRGAADIGHLRAAMPPNPARRRPAPGGDDQSSPPLHSSPARSPLALNADVPCDCAVLKADRTGAKSAAVMQFVAAPSDRKAPHRTGKLHGPPTSNICAIFSKAPSPSTVGRALHDHLRGVGRDGVGDLEIHRRLTARLARLAAHHGRGELRQSVRGGECVEVGLVETVEGEEHDRGALAGEAGVGQLREVVRVAQRVGRQALVRHVQGNERRARFVRCGV